MASRGHESPMDFQWENASGRVDQNSPFTMHTMQHTLRQESPNKRPPQPLFQTSPTKAPPINSPFTRKPSIFATPNSKPPIASPFRTPAFTNPRNTFEDSDIFSAPTDNDDSPSMAVDSDAPTPEANRLSALLKNATVTPSRISGRGEVPRPKSHGVTKPRRRRPHQKLQQSHYNEEEKEGESSSSEPDSPEERRNTRPSKPRRKRDSWGDWAATHREIPVIASQYLQFFINLSLGMIFLYALFSFFRTISRDIGIKTEAYRDEIIQEMATCQKEYIENRCRPDLRVPAMEIRCSAWELCMNRDSENIARTRVGAETVAEVINNFIEPLSFKTMAFTLVLFFGFAFISNWALAQYRVGKLPDQPTPSYIPNPMPNVHWGTAYHHEQSQWHPQTPMPSTPARMGPPDSVLPSVKKSGLLDWR